MPTKSTIDFETLNKADIISLLNSQGAEKDALFVFAGYIKELMVGSKVFLRGLIEFSNYCEKDCQSG